MFTVQVTVRETSRRLHQLNSVCSPYAVGKSSTCLLGRVRWQATLWFYMAGDTP